MFTVATLLTCLRRINAANLRGSDFPACWAGTHRYRVKYLTRSRFRPPEMCNHTT